MRLSKPTRHRCPRRNQRWRSYARRRLRATPGQDDSADAAVGRRLFIGRRAETAIAGRQIRCAAEDRHVAIQGRGPQRHIGWPFQVDLVRADDLVFRFLNGDELAELVRLRDLPLATRLGMRFEEAQDFVDDVRITPQEARARLVDDPLHERPQTTSAPSLSKPGGVRAYSVHETCEESRRLLRSPPPPQFPICTWCPAPLETFQPFSLDRAVSGSRQ